MKQTSKPPAAPARRIRSDGWTLARQRQFIKMLALTGSVEQAAVQAQMSAASAYRLRAHPVGTAFRHAWEAALGACAVSLREIAFDRVINGVAKPVVENGLVVGHEPVFNDTLLMFMLRRYDDRSQRSPQKVMLDSFDMLVEVDVPDAEAVAPEPEGEVADNANPAVNLV